MKAFQTFVIHLTHELAGFFDDPFADRYDETALFGEGNEFVGGNRTVLGAVPAQERFKPGYFFVRQAYFRLELQGQFLTLQGASQTVGQDHFFIGFGLQCVFKERPTVSAVPFRSIHGAVGVLQDIIGSQAVIGIKGNAHTGRHVDPLAGNRIFLAQRLHQVIRHLRDHGPIALSRPYYHKLVAANPGDERLHTDRFPDMVAGGDDYAISQGVPQSVIDGF